MAVRVPQNRTPEHSDRTIWKRIKMHCILTFCLKTSHLRSGEKSAAEVARFGWVVRLEAIYLPGLTFAFPDRS